MIEKFENKSSTLSSIFWKEIAGSSDVVYAPSNVQLILHMSIYTASEYQQDKEGINLNSMRLPKFLHMEDASYRYQCYSLLINEIWQPTQM